MNTGFIIVMLFALLVALVPTILMIIWQRKEKKAMLQH